MLDKAKNFVLEHKKELIFTALGVASVGLGAFIGYRVGTNKGGVKLAHEFGNSIIPNLIDELTYSGYYNTCSVINKLDPSAFNNIFRNFTDKEFMNLVLNEVCKDSRVKCAMELADGLSKAKHM